MSIRSHFGSRARVLRAAHHCGSPPIRLASAGMASLGAAEPATALAAADAPNGGGARARRERRQRAEARIRLALARGAAQVTSHRGGTSRPKQATIATLSAEVAALREELAEMRSLLAAQKVESVLACHGQVQELLAHTPPPDIPMRSADEIPVEFIVTESRTTVEQPDEPDPDAKQIQELRRQSRRLAELAAECAPGSAGYDSFITLKVAVDDELQVKLGV
jgi:hypothetical protein